MGKNLLVITGAGGFLGRGLIDALGKYYRLRLVDIRDFSSAHEKRIGDVADPDFCLEILKDADLLLVAHMSQRPCETPFGPFNSNVTGTANLLYAAVENGVKRACVVSSVDAVHGEVRLNGRKHAPELRPSAVDIYSATKACQEIVSEAFNRKYGIEVAALRIGYVVDCDHLVNKYGARLEKTDPGMIDPVDCGEAIAKILELPAFGYRVWYLYSVCDDATAEGFPARQELGWLPKHHAIHGAAVQGGRKAARQIRKTAETVGGVDSNRAI